LLLRGEGRGEDVGRRRRRPRFGCPLLLLACARTVEKFPPQDGEEEVRPGRWRMPAVAAGVPRGPAVAWWRGFGSGRQEEADLARGGAEI
jgi:hypothetical protein